MEGEPPLKKQCKLDRFWRAPQELKPERLEFVAAERQRSPIETVALQIEPVDTPQQLVQRVQGVFEDFA